MQHTRPPCRMGCTCLGSTSSSPSLAPHGVHPLCHHCHQRTPQAFLGTTHLHRLACSRSCSSCPSGDGLATGIQCSGRGCQRGPVACHRDLQGSQRQQQRQRQGAGISVQSAEAGSGAARSSGRLLWKQPTCRTKMKQQQTQVTATSCQSTTRQLQAGAPGQLPGSSTRWVLLCA